MLEKTSLLALVAGAITLSILGRGHAQTSARTPPGPQAPAPQAYRPGLGDPMTTTVFAEAYGRLTATCNACHQSTERAFVVIQAPKASPFPDQDFQPIKPR